MTFLALISFENDRVSKFQEFDSRDQAEAHVDQHGGIVYENKEGYPPELLAFKNGVIEKLSTPVKDLRIAAIARLEKHHAAFLKSLTGSATPEERDTWHIKSEAARAVLAEKQTQAQEQMLALEAEQRGISSSELATIIVTKSDAYHVLVGQASALKEKGRALIETASNKEVLQQLEQELLAEAQQQAAAWLGAH